MFCNRCGHEATEGQRFCTKCGASLAGITDRTEELHIRTELDSDGTDAVARAHDPSATTEPHPTVDPAAHEAEHATQEPAHTPGPGSLQPPPAVAAAAAGAIAGPQLYDYIADEDTEEHSLEPGAAGPDPTTSPPRTAEGDGPTNGQTTATAPPWAAPTTDQFPVVPPVPTREPRPRFAVGAATGMAVLTLVVTLVAAVANVVSITTDAVDPLFDVGDWTTDDLASNLMIAGVVGAGACLLGAVAAGFHQRWGAGLAGGAGLAIAGWSGVVVGLAEQPIALAERVVRQPTTEPFSITITRDLGYWLALAAGALGVLTFIVSLTRAGNDRRTGLNPWLAALGAVAALIAAAGPLLPVGTATIEQNWQTGSGVVERPTAYVVGRLVQLGALALAGVLGFLLVRRYGLGLAVGATSVYAWLTVTALADVGGSPIGPGIANPGASPDDVHGVTVFGVGALVAISLLAILAAYNQTVRER